MTFHTIGTDTEVFAVDEDGEHVALCGLIGGTKENPMQIEGLPPGFAFQEDNVSLEWNIPPAQTLTEFQSSIKTINREVYHTLRHLGLKISTEVGVSFSKHQLTHPKALEFGCEPDYNAWKMIENERPQAKDASLRTAGGHIHVGTDMEMVQGVQLMDLYLGIPSVILDNNEPSKKRRELYGKAGAMRPKPYGFEYRVLSNFWVFNPQYVDWVFNTVKRICQGSANQKISNAHGKLIEECINTQDTQKAKEIIQYFSIFMPNPLKIDNGW